MKSIAQFEIISFASQKDFEVWLRKNHVDTPGVWVRFYKKDSSVKTVTYAEAVDVALCYGWIDSLAKKYDDLSYLQKFTPRGPRSVWSQRNTENIERLIRLKKMRPAGLTKVEEAKLDGRWERAYASPKNVTMPEDFGAALAADKRANAFFATLNKANTYGFITRVQFAKKAGTRAKRIRQFVEMLSRGEKLH